MAKSDVQAQFDHLLSRVLWPYFKERGYKKCGANFRYYDAAGWGKIVNVQKSVYSSKSDISFTINTGLYLPKAELYNLGRISAAKFLAPDCIVRKRIGSLTDANADLWYNLELQTVWPELEVTVSQAVKLLVLPYLDSIGSVEDVLQQVFRERGADVFAGIRAVFVYGHKAQARQWLADELAGTLYTHRKKQLQSLSDELDLME